MTIVKFEAYQNEDGSPDPNHIAIKLRKNTIDPALMGMLLNQKVKILDFAKAHYNQYHRWKVTKVDAGLFAKYLASFGTPEKLSVHLAELQEVLKAQNAAASEFEAAENMLSNVVKKAKPPVEIDEDDDQEDEVEDEDSDED